MTRFLPASTAKRRKAVCIDELQDYLKSLEQGQDRLYVDGGDLLAYWCAKRKQWPNLTRMAREILACPPTTAGIERLFSRAGRYRTKLQRRTKESTLELLMYVASNYPLIDLCKRIKNT
eukprot:GHVU01031923.1.p3 GENE.GHVU01031923.1~~GHVU01031923.1.p3  ORF type:complete len:119 (-),score=15.13 GHVU01031923.1:292-648(-)